MQTTPVTHKASGFGENACGTDTWDGMRSWSNVTCPKCQERNPANQEVKA